MNRCRYAVLCLCSALAALSACEGRRDEPRQPESTATRALPPAPTVSASPSASIIRPDIAPQPAVDLPPPPVTLTVGFPTGGARLDPAAEQALAQVLETEQFEEGWPIVLRGHSDSAGSDRANLAVSRRRAEAVARWLEEHGVPKDRLEIVAFGEQNPVAPNARPDGTPNEQGRARNRRVEIRIAAPSPSAEPENDAEEAGKSKGA
jgi:OOP family OmpA-OmpF porin